jgi:hypothetical protein
VVATILKIALTLLAALPAPQQPQQPRRELALPPSTLQSPTYIELPATIEIVNMTPQVVADLVASGKITVDGANHLTLPQGPMLARIGPDMLRPGAQAESIPVNSAERPLKLAANRPLLVAAPAKFALVSKHKAKLTVQGNRLVLTEIK